MESSENNLDPTWCYYSDMPSPSAYSEQNIPLSDENTPPEPTHLRPGELSYQSNINTPTNKNRPLK